MHGAMPPMMHDAVAGGALKSNEPNVTPLTTCRLSVPPSAGTVADPVSAAAAGAVASPIATVRMSRLCFIGWAGVVVGN